MPRAARLARHASPAATGRHGCGRRRRAPTRLRIAVRDLRLVDGAGPRQRDVACHRDPWLDAGLGHQVLDERERPVGRRLVGRSVPAATRSLDLVIGQRRQPAADLGQRQVLLLEAADEPQPCEVALAIAGARARLLRRRQQPLRHVVAHGARRHAREAGEVGDGVRVVRHVRNIDSVTVHCQDSIGSYASMAPLRHGAVRCGLAPSEPCDDPPPPVHLPARDGRRPRRRAPRPTRGTGQRRRRRAELPDRT